MKFIDEKGKLFGIINVIDLAVLFVILAIVVAAAYKFIISPGMEKITSVQKIHYEATFRCPMCPPNTPSMLKEGDRLYYDDIKFIDATIKSVTYEPAKVEVSTEDGRIILADHPYFVDIYVIVDVPVSQDAEIVMLCPKYQVTVGKELSVKTARVEIKGTVTDLVLQGG